MPRDVDRLLAFLPEFYQAQNLQTLPQHVVEFIRRVIRVDTSAYNVVNLSRRGVNILIDPPPEAFGVTSLTATARETMHEHPIITHCARTGDNRALRLSDFTSGARFRRSRLYNEIFRPMRIEYLMTIVGAIAGDEGDHVALSLSRERLDFNERELRMLELLRPHFQQIYSNAKALSHAQQNSAELHGVLEETNPSMILVRDYHILYAGSQARDWLRKYFAPMPRSECLPDAIARWTKHWQSSISGELMLAQPCAPLVVEHGPGVRLVVRFIPRIQPGTFQLLLSEQPRREDPLILEQRLGLSRREAEILLWIADGKTSAEIASILSISRRTVDKHLEHIYAKLGVETRTAAAAMGWNVLRAMN